MNIDRAKQLAAERHYKLVQGVTAWDWDLHRSGHYRAWEYVDTLNQNQILHLDEADFIEFYLTD